MKILMLLPLLFILGCAHTTEKEVIVSYVYTKVVCEEFNPIEPIRPLPVKFVRGVDTTGNQVLGLRGDQYSNLAINGKDTIRYIIEQKKAIGYYEKCIVDHNTEQEQKEEEQ